MRSEFHLAPEADFLKVPHNYGCVGGVPRQVVAELPDGGTLQKLQCIILYIGSIEMNCYPLWGIFSPCDDEEAKLIRQGMYNEHLYVATGLLIPALNMEVQLSHLNWIREQQWKDLVDSEIAKRGELWTSN